jgi:serine/threonine protein kinase
MPRETLVVEKLADLAQGGMGSVEIAVARDGRLAGKVLAIKRLHEELARDQEIVSMFMDEAWLTAQIADPHVVRVEAFCEDARGLFLATELVRGVSLGRLMAEARARGEPFAERTVAFIASQTCSGLSAAHDLRDQEGTPLGLVHRDLTPGNVLVSFEGIVKITDFGIAKAERRVSANTRMGVLKGKPSYVSPEQVRGGAIDARADLFALGIVLFELLAGRRPWRGKDDTDVLIAMMRTEPPRLAELRPNVSPALGNLVDACLRKRPEERPQSAAEVRKLIDAFRNERGFMADDLQSLAAFVARNTAELSTWFDDALGGALSKGGRSLQQAQEQIDATRVQKSPLAQIDAPARTVTDRTVDDDTTSDGVATAAFQHKGPLPGAEAMRAAMRGSSPAVPTVAEDEPESGRTVAFPSEQASRLRAETPARTPAGTQFIPAQPGRHTPMGTPMVRAHDALSQIAQATPIQYSPKTELLSATTPMHPVSIQRSPSSSNVQAVGRTSAATGSPASSPASSHAASSHGPGSSPASSAPRSPPVTEWMQSPPRSSATATPLPGSPAGSPAGSPNSSPHSSARSSAHSSSIPLIDPSTGLPATVNDSLLQTPASAALSRTEPRRGSGRVVLVFLLVFILSVAGVGALLRFGIIKLH